MKRTSHTIEESSNSFTSRGKRLLTPTDDELLSSIPGMQEIASPLEASVSSQDLLLVSPEQQKDNHLQLHLQPSLALWHALQRYLYSASFTRQHAAPCGRLLIALQLDSHCTRVPLWAAKSQSKVPSRGMRATS